MSVVVSCIAERINLVGPTMGSYGYVGLVPSLEIKLDYVRDSDRKGGTFGWIYDALSSIGLITYQLDNFKYFLTQCGGDKVHLTTDHDDEYPPNINMSELEYVDSISEKEYKVCSYKLFNPNTGSELVYLNSHGFDKFIPCTQVISQSSVENFITKIDEVDIWHEFFNQMGILDPVDKMEELVNFVKDNKDQELVVETKEI
ncbi:hypothetical protein Q4601_04660 [Shewanella sp. 1_MG-2023]|uniref:hypothetical protein n=1 Tax=unclassified Shewanella TaxID=196818 RepID=UPI0026E3422D|nr:MULTISPECIES: hypothetical protein [unclassified Shewanella]MDO6611509.1 hypothetical protein [Shewanella sp. 7_MG-2023]MDO6771364.1 hypothetical protein [Shewanella sp. 2_MG-2023]MDO6793590.1 hypothetical protein [Shewanella sp. 1_MG-2023]